MPAPIHPIRTLASRPWRIARRPEATPASGRSSLRPGASRTSASRPLRSHEQLMPSKFRMSGDERRRPSIAAVTLLRAIAACGGVLLLTGCKTFSPDGGLQAVAEQSRQELNKDVVAIRSEEDAASARS